MYIHEGIELLGNVTSEKRGIRNGLLYTVASIDREAQKVQFEGIEHAFSFDQVKKWLVLSFARTYASIQGTEFEESVCLHDTSHQFFTSRHLFVGLSRCKDPAFIALKP